MDRIWYQGSSVANWARLHILLKKGFFMNSYDEPYMQGQRTREPFIGPYQPYPFYPYLSWTDEKTRDRRRFQDLYPSMARQIQPLVEEECDRQEYDGSFMFDEYPDRFLLRRAVRRICDQLDKRTYQDELRMQESDQAEWIEDLVTVMLLNEMYQRRCRRRDRRFGGIF